MTWYMIVFLFIALLGAFTLAYQIFRLTELDAKCRGLKHPKFWGFSPLVEGMATAASICLWHTQVYSHTSFIEALPGVFSILSIEL